MNTSETLTIEENGKLTLPNEVLERYHITKEKQSFALSKRKKAYCSCLLPMSR